MTPLQKIRTSFTTQLWLLVAGFVVVISGVALFLLARFSVEVIRGETIDTTLQVLENTALRIDNTLRHTEMSARLEGRRFHASRQRIERLVAEDGSEALLRRSLPHIQVFVTQRDSSPQDAYITGSQRGCRQMVYEDREVYIFTQPVGERPLSLVAMCPAGDVDSRYSRMSRLLLSWGVCGVLALLWLLYLVIAKHLRPLHLLADAAQRIADGNLDTHIPDSRHEHETGRLLSSLKKMQQSLRAYMAEMQRKQATLSEQNAELQAAYGQAQAYETKKVNFLHQMTTRMAAPVEQVCRCTDTICCNYRQLSQGDMADRQANVMHGTEEIIQLLDQLIKDPADA